nr:ribonuclease H-like domain-containing protein [Tanacetum cinerariifolium]
MTDYSLWEVILNEKRLAKKNELKARGTLLMALSDKHQLKFNIHKDAKSLIEAIEKRFGGNKETKKVQKTLLKQHQLEILGESLSQEDIDMKFLRSFPSEWRTHTLIWRNKADLEDQSLDDLLNNLKIYEAEVKSSSSTSHTTQNIAFVSSNNTYSPNELVSAVPSVSAASTKALVSTLPNVDNLTDAVIYSFFASQSNNPQLDNEDLKQTDADDLEEIDLKWQMAMLTMRARRFLQRTRRNLGECRSPRDTKNKDTQRRTILVETSTSNALVSQCDGVGSYDWSFQDDEEPTNYALMTFTSSSSSSSGSDNEVAPCSKACLEYVEARLVVYQQNENVFEEYTKLLKLDVMLRDNALVELRKKFEKSKKERDELKHTLEKFQTSSKNISKLLGSQITDKTGLGYDNQVFNSHMFNCDELNSSELDDSVPTSLVHDSETVPNVVNVEPSTTKPTKDMSQSNKPSTPIIEDWVSDFEDESEGEPMPTEKEPSFVQASEHVKTTRTFVKPPARNHAMRVNHQNSARMADPHSNKHVVPTTVLTKSRLVPLNAARLVTTAVPQTIMKNQRPVKHVVNKEHSPIRRPINHRPASKNSNFYQKVTTIKTKKVNTVQSTKGIWVWKLKCTVLDHVSRLTSASMTLKQFDYTDALGRSNGCSIHMTGNISYLSDFEEINGGYVSFGGNPKGGKITGKLAFDDVYFVKELKFNLFSVLQICNKKNNVLFIDTECVVLSSDFKLPDENRMLLRVPRENNMYNIDLKNIVPSGDLTYLFAKAILDDGGFRRLTTPMLHQGLRHHSPTPQGVGCHGGAGGRGGPWRWWMVDLIDRDTRNHFGVRQKISPETFSAAAVGRRWWLAVVVAGRRLERREVVFVCVLCIENEMK